MSLEFSPEQVPVEKVTEAAVDAEAVSQVIGAKITQVLGASENTKYLAMKFKSYVKDEKFYKLKRIEKVAIQCGIAGGAGFLAYLIVKRLFGRK